jgi:hypothetical protein
MILLKPSACNILSRFLTTTNFESSKAVYVLNRIEILKKVYAEIHLQTNHYLLFLSTVKQQELTLFQMKYQFENDLGILNYLSGTNEKSAIVLTQPEMELKPLIAPGSSIYNQQFEIDSLSIQNQKENIANNYKPSVLLFADAGITRH